MSVDAKAAVLERIRAAKGGAAELGRGVSAWGSLPRGYHRHGELGQEEMLERLTERLVDYDAVVERCGSADVTAAVARALDACGAKRVLAPAGLDVTLPGDVERVDDGVLGIAGLTTAELDRVDAVVTRSTVAIAETGTLVLQGVAGQGRRAATLVPDVHVCVVRVRDVVMTVPEAFDRLAATATLPTTFVSGPSATADIEMTRIKGVHGPRTLFVVLEDDDVPVEGL